MGFAQREGALWGAHAHDWADLQQHTIRPAAFAVLRELGPWRTQRLLDIGCGAGDFAHLANGLGATVNGLDASAPLIEIARQRTPSGSFQVGDMQAIPFPDNHFTVVTAFNSLHFAANPAAAVTEAIRVLRPDGRIVAATWGPPAECDAIGYLLDLGALMPSEPLDTSPLLDPSDPDTLKTLLATSGLTTSPWRTVPCPWTYADLNSALRGLLSTGPATQAINHSGRATVTATITESISPYRHNDGSYLLNNTCHYLIATLDQ